MYQNGILVLDFGGPEARAVARRMRGEQVFAGVLPYDAQVSDMRSLSPKGLILAGGDGDAFAPGAPAISDAVYALGLPMLGFGYGAHAIARHMGAQLVELRSGAEATQVVFGESELFSGLSESERVLDRLDVIRLPEGFSAIAHAPGGVCVAFEHREQRLFGTQFYPEANDPDGLLMLRNFARNVCGVQQDWTIEGFLDWSLNDIRAHVGDGRALIAISGGVDSSVCATLIQRAIGDRLQCVHVDTGLMRKGEREQVQGYFGAHSIPLTVIEAQPRFLERLSGIADSEQKRHAVYEEYERVVAEAMRQTGSIDWLAQGTIYTDVLDDTAYFSGEQPKLLEPLRLLFKEEVRDLGALLGLPPEIVNRQAFPAAGLAVRCMGEVSRDKLTMLREADWILREEISTAGLDKRIRQYFAVLLDVRTRGAGAPGYTVALRAVNPSAAGKATAYRLPYDLLERIVDRVAVEVKGVNRVVYDVTSQPPATIEWN